MDSGCRDVRGGLRALALSLSRKGMAKNVQVRPMSKGQSNLNIWTWVIDSLGLSALPLHLHRDFPCMTCEQ